MKPNKSVNNRSRKPKPTLVFTLKKNPVEIKAAPKPSPTRPKNRNRVA